MTSLLQGSMLAMAAAPQAHEAQLLDIDGTVFVMLAIFLVLLLVLWQFLWKPYLRVRDERVARVEGAKEKASQLDGEAAARVARIDEALADARRSSLAETAKLRAAAQAREQQILAEAQERGREMVAEARRKLETALAAEKANLKSEAVLLSRAIAEKALGRRVVS